MRNAILSSIKRNFEPCQVWFNHLWSYPSPASFNMNFTFGSLSLVALIIQIISGLLLTMHYTPNVDAAFGSVEHIMRDVTGGSFLRYTHANGASFFFFCLYWHIGRALYYKSYIKNSSAWFIGIVIFVLVMGAAFFGYVLPWGQMSFWGATVITNLFSVIPFVGLDLVHWLWGGFGVGNPTLNRFYTFHFLIPFVILGLVFLHLYVLHGKGSSTPKDGGATQDGVTLGQYFIQKDILFATFFVAGYFLFVLYSPNFLNHSDNYIVANPMQTPAHIVPEWYLLPFYAILRTIPNKSLGVIAMGYSIFFLAGLPHIALKDRGNAADNKFHVAYFWIFVLSVLMLGFLGGQPIEEPYTDMSYFFMAIYLSYVPVTALYAAYTRMILTFEEFDALYMTDYEYEYGIHPYADMSDKK